MLRPDGLLLVAFQSGRGVRDISESYRRCGHVAPHERDAQTVLVAQA